MNFPITLLPHFNIGTQYILVRVTIYDVWEQGSGNHSGFSDPLMI